MLGRRVFFLKAAFAIAILDLITLTVHLIHLKATDKNDSSTVIICMPYCCNAFRRNSAIFRTLIYNF
jgi:hypothetical protein